MTVKHYDMTEDEINRLLREIFEYAVKGLGSDAVGTYKDGFLAKQWYLERIFLATGGSLTDIRQKFDCMEGIPPQFELDPGPKEYKK